MKFTLDNDASANVVTARAPGEVHIAGRLFRASLLVNAHTLVEDWPVTSVDGLQAALEPVFALAPEILVLGTGERQAFPAPDVFAAITSRGIGFEVMDNGAACRTYNVLLAEGRNAALALIL